MHLVDGLPISIPESLVPTSGRLDSLAAIEDVLMIGYPKGFGDSVNNLPIVRRGTTATPAYLNYNGLPQFLVDIPIYTGSSGSPIFIYNSNYVDKKGTMVFAIRSILLGIVVQSQDYVAKGSVLSSKKIKLKTETLLPFGIAVVIKSSELMGLKPNLVKAINDPEYYKLFVNILK